MGQRSDELAAYYFKKRDFGRDLQENIIILGELQSALYRYGEADLAKRFEEAYDRYAKDFQERRVNPNDY
jgi:hypothetical protein